jgi:4-hydroxy-2-oxoheptanedioate aldolase
MKITDNPFKTALCNGEKQLGIWSSLCSGLGADIIASAKFDWVLIDMEHSANDVATVLQQLQVYAAFGTHPVVRPPWNEPVIVKRLLDMGAFSLMFPMVQNAQEAAAAVSSCRYPPHGIRGVSLNHRGNRFGAAREDYLNRGEAQITILVQIETQEALANLEEIAAVEGVDGVFFGPADLSANMSLLGQPAHPDVSAAIEDGVARLAKIGVPSGILVGDSKQAIDWFSKGVGFVAAGSDLAVLANGLRSLQAACMPRPATQASNKQANSA